MRYGDGGAGPGYGIIPLAQSISEWEPDPIDGISRPFLPSPDVQTMNIDRPFPDDGLLPIAQMGCGWECVWVVTGQERGSIWQFVNDYLPVSRDRPSYPANATAEDRLAANERHANALLMDSSRRLTLGLVSRLAGTGDAREPSHRPQRDRAGSGPLPKTLLILIRSAAAFRVSG